MRTVFTIGDNSSNCDILLIEIGADSCCYALLNGQERNFYRIKCFAYDEFEAEENILSIFQELKKEGCEKVFICSAFSEALLIPNKYGENKHALMQAVYDLSSYKNFRDNIPEWQLMNAYSMPASVFNIISDQFPLAQFIHAYTAGLKIYNGFVAADQIDIHFSTRYFRVLVKKNKQVHLAQTYSYKTPLDVVYYLLKICYEFQLHQSEVSLIVSGLIDKDSAMYNELHNYFINLHFAQAPAFSVPGNEHPHHYFTSLYNLAACVS